MNTTLSLMLGGIVAACPDCGDEQVLVEVGDAEYCCAACDAAVTAAS